MCDTLTEAMSYIFGNIENNKMKLNFDEKNDTYFILFSFQLPNSKEEIFNVIFDKTPLKQDKIIDLLIQEINSMKKDICILKNENIKLKNSQKSIEKIENVIEIFYIFPWDKNDLIENAIKEKNEDYKNKKMKLKLIYKATCNGENYSKCHQKCNNIPNTLTIIKTKNDKTFGFFRSLAINGEGPYRRDDQAFFISFDKSKIYRVKTGEFIAFDNECFIQTICFRISGNIISDSYSMQTKTEMEKCFDDFSEDYELNGGIKNFKVEECEVYRLIFD